jgi:hypothetical protein
MTSEPPKRGCRSRAKRLLWSVCGLLLGGLIGSVAGYRYGTSEMTVFAVLGSAALAVDGARSGACILESLLAFFYISG